MYQVTRTLRAFFIAKWAERVVGFRVMCRDSDRNQHICLLTKHSKKIQSPMLQNKKINSHHLDWKNTKSLVNRKKTKIAREVLCCSEIWWDGAMKRSMQLDTSSIEFKPKSFLEKPNPKIKLNSMFNTAIDIIQANATNGQLLNRLNRQIYFLSECFRKNNTYSFFYLIYQYERRKNLLHWSGDHRFQNQVNAFRLHAFFI